MPEPCDYCDTIGPFVRDEQPVRDLHRAWHEMARAWSRAFGPLMEAFRAAGYSDEQVRRYTAKMKSKVAEGLQLAKG